MKHFITLMAAMLAGMYATAQTAVTYEEARTLYQNTTKSRVSVHDPSVTYDSSSNRFYIFGSHKAGGWTSDMQNWTYSNPTWRTASSYDASNAAAFVTPAVKKVSKGGSKVSFPAFNAMDWSARSDSGYDINGNMWAPDVIWNPTMRKWCYYLSINGDAWHSSIVLLTADNVTGPYLYQGPVVVCGFYDTTHSYKDTDLELVLGSQSSLPSRYDVGSNWGNRWPHTIDPSVFYDENGKLWMAYGSWSGGIWMLELDESTGLRDYDVTYPSTNGNSDGVTSDPYFGIKIAGGRYVSGEGPYIEHIGNYYFLFVSYGFYSPNGGYEMRVFRSEKPDGPYTDASGTSAIFPYYQMNYGPGGDTRGEKLLGAYNMWGDMTVGECAQGHNSIVAAQDGRTYLVYHTKFNNGTAGHEVRVHQVLLNKSGWLVAAPFEYNGETVGDAEVASRQPFATADIVGTYDLLLHKYGMDYENYEEVTPVRVTLTADGRVTGSMDGTWAIDAGTGYITLTLGGVAYDGVVLEEVMDTQSLHTVSITACSSTGINVWAYKIHPKYAVAWHLNHQTEPLADGQEVSANIDLYGMDLGVENVTFTWTSSHPDIISNIGKYDPTGLDDDTPVTLIAHLESGSYYWEKAFTVTALSDAHALPAADWKTGIVAHYGFDGEPLANTFDTSEQAQLCANGTVTPTLADGDHIRVGKQLHLYFGVNGAECYAAVPNPLIGQTLDEGATVSFWLKRSDDNLWDGLFSFVAGNARLYMTGNTYIGYNDGNTSGTNNWIDLNHPANTATGYLGTNTWQMVTLVVARDALTLYVDGKPRTFLVCNGSCNGNGVGNVGNFDCNLIVDHLARATDFFLGRGSFWGSPDVLFDDLLVYNRPLSGQEVAALWQVVNRDFDFASLPNENTLVAQAYTRLDAIRAMLEVPHRQLAEDADDRLEVVIDNIEQQVAGGLCTNVSRLTDKATKAAVAFLGEATPYDVEQPFDITFLLKNPGMDSNDGWSVPPVIDFSCGEFYQKTFDLQQTVAGLPTGTYQMRCNAFQRPGMAEECTGRETTAFIYASNESKHLAHVTSAAQTVRLGGNESYVNGRYFPNNMEAASIYFAKGLYDNHVTTTIGSQGGDLTLGIKATLMDGFYWCIFDNFRLYAFGTMDADIVDNYDFLKGDVNADGRVTIADVTDLVSHILGIPPSIFIERAADANDDTHISVADVTTIIDIILNK
ncbi:MAG: family 43 glycosylhydrolase [Prevotella sp.]|nr:family 43 glycosylhydrolase [Prevotella sp.]